MNGPSTAFWLERYHKDEIGWDRGMVNPQLLRWLDTQQLQPCKILVPGCGTGWEVEELARRGFTVTALDYLAVALERTQQRLQAAGLTAELVQADVLEWESDQAFDAIYEQTCMCALYPGNWLTYAQKLHQSLRTGGTLYAMFMQAPKPEAKQGFVQGPPYHCDINAMCVLFSQKLWQWPKPPYERSLHPNDMYELAVPLIKL